LFRTFYTSTGGIPEIYPETVVFFTDGSPTSDRQMGGSYKTGGDLSGQPSYARPPYANYQAGVYNQASFNRASYVATQNRARTRLVAVGVGGINDSITWVDNPGAGIALSWERASGSYYSAETVYQTNRTSFQIGTSFSSNLDYEDRNGSSWSNTPHDISPTRTSRTIPGPTTRVRATATDTESGRAAATGAPTAPTTRQWASTAHAATSTRSAISAPPTPFGF
jgi:hypothetical protein